MELMSSEFHSYSLKSHPDKLLVDHLGRVGRLSRGMIRERALNLGHQEKEILEDVAYLMGVTHDLGKATRFFRNIYKRRMREKRDPCGPRRPPVMASYRHFLHMQ